MKKNILLVLLLLSVLVSNAQCFILFEPHQVETASDSYTYNALIGKIINSGHFGQFNEEAISYVEFYSVKKDSLTANYNLDSVSVDSLSKHYKINKLENYETNNSLPYSVMAGLYSTDVSVFYSTIYTVGKYNTRNKKPYPFKILPLPEQVFILKRFNITKQQATTIWNAIKNNLG